jgi:AcrR family transcriptional regulator
MSGLGRADRDGVASTATIAPGDLFGVESVAGIQRARLLTAMTDLAAKKGTASVTVAHVVEHAGVSRRTFYELFDDREDCFLAAFDAGIASASKYVLDAYDPQAKWAERVRTGLVALLEFLEIERSVGSLLIVGSLGAGECALQRRRRVLDQVITVIDGSRGASGREDSSGPKELPLLTAEGIVGGALSILHARLSENDKGSLLELTSSLMSMIVLPYLGAAAARRELERPTPKRRTITPSTSANPLRELQMRLTYRTVRVLTAVAAQPGASNRQVADAAEITDQGQISKLLGRLHNLGLIENTGAGSRRGAPNAWTLTAKGWEIENAITGDSRA